MSSDPTHESQVTFRQLKLTLRDIADSFKAWSQLPDGTDASKRMRKLISDHVTLTVDSFISDMSSYIETIDPQSFVGIDTYLSNAVKETNLPFRIPLADCGDIIHWVQGDFMMSLDYGQFVRDAHQIHDLRTRINKVHESARDLSYAFSKELQQEKFEEELSSSRDTIRKTLSNGANLEAALENAQRLVHEVEHLRENSAEQSKQIEDYRQIVDTLAREAEQARQNYQSVQAQQEVLNEEESKTALIDHFDSFHAKHDGKANNFFWFGISVLSTVAIFAVIYALILGAEPITWQSLSWKLAVVAGGSAISTYLLRQSSYHRGLSVWSETVKVQLQTFAPYIQLIGEETSRDQLRMEFARRVFGEEPGRPSKDSDNKADANNLADLSALIANVSKLQSSNQQKNVV